MGRLLPHADGAPYADQIAFVADRLAHDWRYAIDAYRLRDELGWRLATDFDDGLHATVAWDLVHEGWWRPLPRLAAEPIHRNREQPWVRILGSPYH